MRTCLQSFCFILIVALSSCATILNSKTTYVHVYTTVPAKIILQGDTSGTAITSHAYLVKRGRSPLSITATSDTVTKTVVVTPENSFAYWLNLYYFPYSLIGFIIDKNNPKRFTYPNKIYLDMANKESSYYRVRPIPVKFQKYKNNVSLAPLKIINAYNPVVEFTGEKKLNSSWAGAASLGYLLPGFKSNETGNNVVPDTKGFTGGLEAKWFAHRAAPQGFYVGLGFNYLKNSYRAAQNFNHITPDTTFPPLPYYYIDTFSVHKQTYTVNLMFGYQRIYKRFFLDIYGGLGVRFKNVFHVGRKFPGDDWRYAYDYGVINVGYLKNHDGKYAALSVPLNIRIGWTF